MLRPGKSTFDSYSTGPAQEPTWGLIMFLSNCLAVFNGLAYWGVGTGDWWGADVEANEQ